MKKLPYNWKREGQSNIPADCTSVRGEGSHGSKCGSLEITSPADCQGTKTTHSPMYVGGGSKLDKIPDTYTLEIPDNSLALRLAKDSHLIRTLNRKMFQNMNSKYIQLQRRIGA